LESHIKVYIGRGYIPSACIYEIEYMNAEIIEESLFEIHGQIILLSPPKVSKGSETTTPPVAEISGVEEASEKEQCERQRDNATIKQAGPIGKPFVRSRRSEIPLVL
jgi:hypothetical protein